MLGFGAGGYGSISRSPRLNLDRASCRRNVHSDGSADGGRTGQSKSVPRRGCTVMRQVRLPPWLPSFAVAAGASSLFGYDIGASSAVVRLLGSGGMVNHGVLTPAEIGVVTSASLFGALIASVVALRAGNSIGRRQELRAALAIFAVSSAAQALAPNYESLVLARVLYGIGIGTAMHSAPLLIAESVPSKLRGLLVSIKEAFIVLGVLGGYVAGATFAPWADGAWRYMFAAAAVIEIPAFFGSLRIPETPRYLCLNSISAANGDRARQEAVDAAARLCGGDREAAQEDVSAILASLGDDKNDTTSADANRTDNSDFKQLFSSRAGVASLRCGLGLVFFQQFTGQPSVLYYANRIFEDVGLGFSAAVGVGAFKVAVTVAVSLLVERFGRKPLLLVGTGGMTLCLAALSIAFGGQGDELSTLQGAQPQLVLAATILYVGFYQVGFGPITWLMLSEIFPLRVRSAAMAIGTLSNFGSNLVVAASFESLRVQLGSSTLFALFASAALASIAFQVYYVPETKSKTLEEIEDMLAA